MVKRALLLLIAVASLGSCTPEAARGPLVLAAASLQGALDEVADSWAARGHPSPVVSYAGSPTVARQVEQGAEADIVFLADEEWMDRLSDAGLVELGSRRDVLGNSMVLIAPIRPDGLSTGTPENLLSNGSERVAMADPESVPAGRYGKQALEAVSDWGELAQRVVPTDNARAALLLVERGEAALGVVYASDAAASKRVRVVARLPQPADDPIRYPAALTSASLNEDADEFLDYLSSQEAFAIFARHEFSSPR